MGAPLLCPVEHGACACRKVILLRTTFREYKRPTLHVLQKIGHSLIEPRQIRGYLRSLSFGKTGGLLYMWLRKLDSH